MASYPPPNFIEPLSVFNPLNWEVRQTTLTTAIADLRYLKFPVAQGLETLQDTITNGTADFAGNIIMSGTALTNYIEFPDSTKQYTAPVAPVNLLPLNNVWTGTNDFNNLGTGSLTSLAVQPASSDSSTKIPTTAWVQSVISAIPSPSATITGAIIPYAGNSVPSGYLMCDGGSYSTTTYATLFAVIGYTYGGTGGSFSTPNLVNNYIQGSSTSTGASISGAFSVSNNNIDFTTISPTTIGTNLPVVFNSPNGINDWSYLKGTPSGDGGANFWAPRTNNTNKNGSNLVNAFQTNIGVSTPTPIVAKPPSISMRYLIKT
jgi:hypothetical protein